MTNQRHTSGRQRANDRRPGLAPAVAAIGPPLSQIDGCRSVANIVKRVRNEPASIPMRSQAIRCGQDSWPLRRARGHPSSRWWTFPVTSQWTPCGGYVRDAELFKDHAGAGLLWFGGDFGVAAEAAKGSRGSDPRLLGL